MFAVQTEIAEQVIGQFEMLTGPVKAPDVTAAKRKRPESLTAYELTLLGVEKTLSPTRESIAESITILNEPLKSTRITRGRGSTLPGHIRRQVAMEPTGRRQAEPP